MVVLLTGLRGKTGRQLAALLKSKPGVEIRGAGRAVAQSSIAGISTIDFDWTKPQSWPAATAGIDSVYLVKPKTSDPAETVRSFLSLAPGLKKVVLLSEVGCGARAPDTDERRVEMVIESWPCDWTILRPNWFMQNFVEPNYFLEAIQQKHTVTLPSGGKAISFVDTRDIASVAAAALLEPGHAGRAYTLTGPEALTLADVAGVLGRAAGYAIHHEDPALPPYLQELAASGAPASTLAYLKRVYEFIQSGDAALISPDVERVTGHAPRSFAAFVGDHRNVW